MSAVAARRVLYGAVRQLEGWLGRWVGLKASIVGVSMHGGKGLVIDLSPPPPQPYHRPASSQKQKHSNWATLNHKVLRKIKHHVRSSSVFASVWVGLCLITVDHFTFTYPSMHRTTHSWPRP